MKIRGSSEYGSSSEKNQPNVGDEVKPGIYLHWKGGEYEVFGTAPESETREIYVVYAKMYGDRRLEVRRLDLWNKPVQTVGGSQERFTFVRDPD